MQTGTLSSKIHQNANGGFQKTNSIILIPLFSESNIFCCSCKLIRSAIKEDFFIALTLLSDQIKQVT